MPKRELVAASITRDRSGLRRRDVLANAALMGAGLALGPLWFAACSEQSKDITNRGDKRARSRRRTK
jgi:hypothetical protein